MKPFALRSALSVLLPAALLLASCSKKDEPAPPAAPDQGKVMFINAASHVSTLTLKFLVDNNEKASLAYGGGSNYQSISTGSRSVQITSGTQSALTQAIAVEKDKNYTFVAAPAPTTATVNGFLFPDDLTAPSTATGPKAKIRVINLGQNLATTVRLSQVTAVPGAAIVVPNTASNTASPFLEFTPGNNYSFEIADEANTPLAALGNGDGSGTGTKNFEAGKIYTVVLSGTRGSLTNGLKAYLTQNN